MVTTSWQSVPHVTFLYEPDITTFYHEYKELSRKRRNKGKEISFNTMILRVIVEGLKSAPQLNSYLDPNRVLVPESARKSSGFADRELQGGTFL